MKAGDVSNPTRPLATAKAWNSQVYQELHGVTELPLTERQCAVLEEFYAEGDQAFIIRYSRVAWNPCWDVIFFYSGQVLSAGGKPNPLHDRRSLQCVSGWKPDVAIERWTWDGIVPKPLKRECYGCWCPNPKPCGAVCTVCVLA